MVNSVYNWGGASAQSAADPVKAVKACEANSILMQSLRFGVSSFLQGIRVQGQEGMMQQDLGPTLTLEALQIFPDRFDGPGVTFLSSVSS